VTSEPTIAERVALGEKFLDGRDPGWWRPDVERAISLDTLDIRSGSADVLGQRCPRAESAVNDGISPHALYGVLLTGIGDLVALASWARRHGFSGRYADSHAEGDALTAEWKRVISERRAGRDFRPGHKPSEAPGRVSG
jgi:hypothetical protein